MRTPDVVALALLAVLGCSLILPACSRVYVCTTGASCGRQVKQIVLAQNNYQSIRVRGLSGDNYLGGPSDQNRREIPDADGVLRSDNSMAFVALSRLGLIDTLAEFACPQDPFIAVLNTTGRSLGPGCDDFPVEGVPTGGAWATPDSPAVTEAGHTYFSYSMQTRGPLQAGSFSPKMDPRIPLVADRNPFSVAQALGLDQSPTDQSDAGNPWAHDRKGLSMAFMDARVEFLEDARVQSLRIDPAEERSAFGYDYLYGDGDISPTPPSGPPAGSCPPRGQKAYIAGGNPKGWNVWMTD